MLPSGLAVDISCHDQEWSSTGCIDRILTNCLEILVARRRSGPRRSELLRDGVHAHCVELAGGRLKPPESLRRPAAPQSLIVCCSQVIWARSLSAAVRTSATRRL